MPKTVVNLPIGGGGRGATGMPGGICVPGGMGGGTAAVDVVRVESATPDFGGTSDGGGGGRDPCMPTT